MSDAAVQPLDYTDRLKSDGRWALMQGSRHFKEKSDVFHALEKICRRLDEIGVPYAVVGGMALFRHGYQRFTDDIDILVTRESLATIHERLVGLGYLPAFGKSKHLRDTEYGVKIEFLTTGDYPGDGKPKPVAFPDPANVSVRIDDTAVINLETLFELKIASGKSNILRQKDLGDAVELIKTLKLPRE